MTADAYELQERFADASLEPVPEPDGSYKFRVGQALQDDIVAALGTADDAVAAAAAAQATADAAMTAAVAPAAALATTGAAVDLAGGAPPAVGQVLTAASATAAAWADVPGVPLTAARTVYCDSVAGADTNDGSQAAPYKTFARAWQERQRYGVLRARFTIRLVGAGPYALPAKLGASVAGDGGYLIIRGDEAAETTHYSGTFTGDFGANALGCTIGTSAGMGTDTHKYRWVRITSGPAAGAVFQILKNTDTLLTACNRRFKNAGTLPALTNGTTFKVFTPGTQLTGASSVEQWLGGEAYSGTSDPRHVFCNLVFTAAFRVLDSTCAFALCSHGGYLFVYFSRVATFLRDAAASLGEALAVAYYSAGILHTSGAVNCEMSFVTGPFSNSATASGAAAYTSSEILHLGGRFAGPISAFYTGIFAEYASGDGQYAHSLRCEAAVNANGGQVIFGAANVALMEWAVTTGSCMRAMRGGLIRYVGTGSAPTGGTTDLAGYGVDVSGGGRALFEGAASAAPALTGGTAGKDLKTSNNGGVANATLATVGTVAGVAADALLGEVLARVA